jgi:hypothetical protein
MIIFILKKKKTFLMFQQIWLADVD